MGRDVLRSHESEAGPLYITTQPMMRSSGASDSRGCWRQSYAFVWRIIRWRKAPYGRRIDEPRPQVKLPGKFTSDLIILRKLNDNSRNTEIPGTSKAGVQTTLRILSAPIHGCGAYFRRPLPQGKRALLRAFFQARVGATTHVTYYQPELSSV